MNKTRVRISRKVSVTSTELIYMQSDFNYTHFYLKSGKKITVAKTLKQVADELSNHGFIRVHKSYLVNPYHIRSYCNCECELRLIGNHIARVSRRKKTFVKQFLKLQGCQK